VVHLNDEVLAKSTSITSQVGRDHVSDVAAAPEEDVGEGRQRLDDLIASKRRRAFRDECYQGLFGLCNSPHPREVRVGLLGRPTTGEAVPRRPGAVQTRGLVRPREVTR